MFDLNTIINAALNAAVQQAIAPLVERIENLDALCQAQAERITALENNPAQGVEPAIAIDEARMVEALNSQEWFWDKLQRRIDAGIEQSMDHHLECYDHDNYDEIASKVEDYDFDDFVTNDNLEDAVREAVGNLSFEVSVS